MTYFNFSKYIPLSIFCQYKAYVQKGMEIAKIISSEFDYIMPEFV